ncbi:MAG: hypothetical protein ACOCXA_07240, partial [Planctomycetota bacterium]
MADREQQQAQEQIELVEKRLLALQELGVDTSFLHSQLGFARELMQQERYTDLASLIEELLALAANMARRGGGQPQAAPATPVPAPAPSRSSGQRRAVEVGLHTLLDQVGEAVERALADRLPDANDQTDRIREAVQACLAEQRLHQDDTQRIERALAKVLHQQQEQADKPDAGVTARIRRAFSSAMQAEPANELSDRIAQLQAEMAALRQRMQPETSEQALTGRINKAVAAALHDEIPTGLLHVSSSVRRALAETVQSGSQQRWSRRLRADASHGELSRRMIDDVLGRLPETARQRYGEQLRRVLSERFAELVGRCEQRLSQGFARNGPGMEAALERLSGALERRADVDTSVTAIQQQVSALVHAHGLAPEDENDLRELVRDQVMEVLAEKRESGEHPRIDADIADAIEDMIDMLLNSVTGAVTRAMTRSMTRRLLAADTDVATPPPQGTSAPEQVDDDGSSALRPTTNALDRPETLTDGDDESAPTMALDLHVDDQSRDTHLVQREDLSEELSGISFGMEDHVDDQVETAVDDNDDDESSLLDGLLRELIDQDTESEADIDSVDASRPESRPETPREPYKVRKSSKRDRLYELSQESMPASGGLSADPPAPPASSASPAGSSSKHALELHDLSALHGGLDTAQLIK